MFHIVDEDFFAREIMVAMIEHLNYEVIPFPCLDSYIHFTQSSKFKQPTAIFSGITIPRHEMIKTIPRLNHDVSFIVMTGGSSLQLNHADEACLVLQKPFSLEDVIKAIDHVAPLDVAPLGCREGV